MTVRGRATLLTSVVVLLTFVHWSLAARPDVAVDSVSVLALRPTHASAELPPVSMAAPPLRLAKSPPPEILKRLPVSSAVLELPVNTPGDPDGASDDSPGGRLFEWVEVEGLSPLMPGPLRVEYTLDAELTRGVFEVLRRGRVKLGHVILLDPLTGRVLAYASTDVAAFPPTRTYPAASLVKVITAAAALDRDREKAMLPCRYRGSPYRLTRSRIDPPRSGNVVSLRRALATSNNQCFAQLAVHAVGGEALVAAISAFGWTSVPAPAHEAGEVDIGEDRYDIGRLGCGLSGCRITPLHAVQLASVLARGERVAPRWIERVFDASGRELPIPAVTAPRRVISHELAAELREMLVDTTMRGTARSAFRTRSGAPRLGKVEVAGKTGSLSGKDPTGRYEWFIGVAPADEPRIAVAVLMVQGDLWWRSASQIAGDVLTRVFCERNRCAANHVERWLHAVPGEPEPKPSSMRPGGTLAAVTVTPRPLVSLD